MASYEVLYHTPDGGQETVVIRSQYPIHGTTQTRQIERQLHDSGQHFANVIAHRVLPDDWQPTRAGDPQPLSMELTPAAPADDSNTDGW